MSKKTVQLPSEIYECLEEYATAQKVTVDVLVSQTVFESFKGQMLGRGIEPPMPPKRKTK